MMMQNRHPARLPARCDRAVELLSQTLAITLLLAGCSCNPVIPQGDERFAQLDVADVTIGDVTVRSWVAKTNSSRTVGLMEVEAEQLAAQADGAQTGMLFVFPREQGTNNGFWMKNVAVPLDIAFIQSDGTIVTIRTMAPHDRRTTHSKEPYQYALEVSGGVYDKLDINEGDRVNIPAAALEGVQ